MTSKDTSETEAIKKRLEELEKKVEQAEQGVIQNFPAQSNMLVAVSLLLNLAAILSLFFGLVGFEWSVIFGNVIAAYKAVFHIPVDWLFSWVGLSIPWWVKDVFVIFASGYLAANLLFFKMLGTTAWSAVRHRTKSSFFSAVLFLITRIFLYPFIFLTLLFESENKTHKSEAILYFKIWTSIILLAIVLLGFNFAFLKIGL